MNSRKLSLYFFSFLLFLVPVLYSPHILFPDTVKRSACWILLSIAMFLGPLSRALKGNGLILPAGKTPLFLLFGLAILSVIWGQSLPLALESISLLLLGICLAITATYELEYINQEGLDTNRFIWLPLLLAESLAAGYGLLQSLGIEFPGVPYNSRIAPVSTFGNTNYATEFCAPLIAVAFVIAATHTKILGRIGLIALFLLAAYIATTRVRAGWIAGAVAFVMATGFLLGSLPKQRWIRLLIPTVAVALGFMTPLMKEGSPDLEQQARKENTVEVRKEIYFSSVPRMILEKPVLGWGTGQFQLAFPPFRTAKEIELSSQHGKELSSVEEPHNDYLLFASELGLVGALLLAWFGISMLRCWKWSLVSLHSAIAFSMLCAIGVNALFRSPLTNPSSQLLFWSLIGVLSFESNRFSILNAKLSKIVAGVGILLLLGMMFWQSKRFLSECNLSSYFHEGRTEFSLLENASELDPWDLRKLDILATYQKEKKGDLQASRASYEKLLQIHPNHVGAHLKLGLIHLESGNYQRAVEEIQFAQKLNAGIPLVDLRNLGAQVEAAEWEKQKRGETADFSKAQKLYDLHLRLHPKDAEVWMAIGQLFRNAGDEEEAKHSWAQAHRLYGIEHLRHGKTQEAEKQFRLYQRFAKESDPLPELFLIVVLLEKNERDEAKRSLQSLGEKGIKQQALREEGLEKIAVDPELRKLLKP